jgi:nickel-dependent lactate racemase
VSRPTPVYSYFRPVRDALVAAGARHDDIEILFALGVHRPMSEEEACAKIGAAYLAEHRWHNHDAFDRSQLIHVGTTERGTPLWFNHRLAQVDLVVTLGAIEPHTLLGFSGGYKMLLPGCAGAETIGRNHMQGISQGVFNYVGIAPDESPMRLDLEEGVERLGVEIVSVNAALTPDARVAKMFCGAPREVVRAGARFVRDHSEIEVPEQADVVLANSAPFDADLRQSMKCMGNTMFAARPGGMILGFLRCDGGRGDVTLPPRTLPYPINRTVMRVLGEHRIMPFVQVIKKHEPIEERFLTHFALQVLRRNHLYIFSQKLEPDVGKRTGVLRQFTDLKEMLAAAEAKLGSRATVAVFPQGGCTYTRGPTTTTSRTLAG